MSLGLDREEEVIAEFSELLNSYFMKVTLLEYPDRLIPDERQFSEITTDSLIRLVKQNKKWLFWKPRKKQLIAVDIMLLALNRENLVANDFCDNFDPIASDLQVNISLFAHSAIYRSELSEFQIELLEAINNSPTGGTFELRAGISLNWVKATPGAQGTFDIVALPMHAPSACLADQICAENVSPLLKKTKPGGQAARAQKLNIPYVLILDGIGQDDVLQGMHSLAKFPFTYRMGILQALGERASLVSAIFLLDKEGNWWVLKNDLDFFVEVSSKIGAF
ncbi:MAG: hypothetical protein Q8L08_07065 [Candidatus Nanopelagicaceae bacterium]|nr:hypothetical protein [Candidatus Nanopelagicaceae bacterium]